MHLCEIEALAVGQDGSGPSPVAEGQLPGAASNSQSRPEAAVQPRRLEPVVRRRYRLEAVAKRVLMARWPARQRYPSSSGM
jgi:hypothetical protein